MATSSGLLLASGNAKKRLELGRLLADLPVQLRSLAEFADLPEAPEEGLTFQDNADCKALFYEQRVRMCCIADDSGLEVEALAGAPGVRSARYAGEQATDSANRSLLLQELAEIPEAERLARFCCALALAEGGRIVFRAQGTCKGRILFEERGTAGFGYDSLFFSADLQKSFAEATEEEKDRVSHRGRALAQLRQFLLQRSVDP
jgi:XTP/dITP diphosphohydrolase